MSKKGSAEQAKSERHTRGRGDVGAQQLVGEEHLENELEEGRIYFLYRPRVRLPEAEPRPPRALLRIHRGLILLADFKRFYYTCKRNYCVARAVSESMESKLRAWDQVRHGICSTLLSNLTIYKGLGPREYETKTCGVRRKEAAQVAGKGLYSIALRIFKEDLTKPNPPGAGLLPKQKAVFPEDKMKLFEGVPRYAWIPVIDPSLLDYPHCELLFIGAKFNPEVDPSVDAHLAEIEEAEREGDIDDKALVERLRQELQADMAGIKVEPAVEGSWV
ncbi:hypothetical protein WJX81_000546 [Elliptochloris bilobata]|uniref:Uncharacterized protein n=1 Tax=Elliptochloris bilobata TaxID=381761 RepID=A0AAW1QIK4_9CHLO